MKYIFFGTPQFAAVILEKLIQNGFAPQAVVCNPDKPVGRKHILASPPAKIIAQKYDIPVLQPENLKMENWETEIKKIKNEIFDFFLVAAYAKIIPRQIFESPRLGTLVVHPSLLPKYRGATPIQSVILNGETETGTTLFLIDEKIDNGPIIASEKYQTVRDETFETLAEKLAELSADLLIETLPRFTKGETASLPQDESQASYTKKFKTEDGYVEAKDLETAQNSGGAIAVQIERKIRALNPEPGVWTLRLIRNQQKRVKLLEAKLVEEKLKIVKIQVEGGRPQRANGKEQRANGK